MSNFYVLDVITTTGCNLRCKYCYEGAMTHHTKKISPELVPYIYDRIDELLESKFILDNFGGLSLQLFGGEPSINPEFLKNIIERYKNNNRVEFLIFSNGYNIDPIYDILKEVKSDTYRTINNRPKCLIQISYDGKEMQDINRRTVGNKPSSEQVMKTINMIIEDKIPFAIKSTVTEETCHLLPNSYDDVLDIARRANRVKFSAFFPTLDYRIYERNFEKYAPIMKKALMELAKKEIEFYNDNGRFFFNWFMNKKALCSAGYAMSVINVNGQVYPCHGCLYGDDLDKHLWTDVKNEVNFVNIIKEQSNRFKSIYKKVPEKCKNCDATYCLKCNSAKFEASDKKEYLEKWVDHTNQPYLCDYYMLISEVRKAMNTFLKK